MGCQRVVHRRVVPVFPGDFPRRLERFREASGLSWRSLARRLGVSPYRVREWRRGVVPDYTHLFTLILLAEEMGLQKVLTDEHCQSLKTEDLRHPL